jgi:hypothetical protein
VHITARDEIGMLGGVLHLMAERLNVSRTGGLNPSGPPLRY